MAKNVLENEAILYKHVLENEAKMVKIRLEKMK